MAELAQDQKLRALAVAVDQIEKQHGKGSIMKLSDHAVVNVDVIPTGSLSMDAAIGVGGMPRGRIVEIYGPESSGKTTVCLHVIAEAQKRGGLAAFIDAEHALDVTYAKKVGVDVNSLLLSQPEFGEQALDIVETLVRSGALDVVVIDSVAALVPRAEIEGEMGDAQMGSQARLMSQAMRKLNAAIGKSSCVVIFTNQLRSKIGVIYGNPETTTGGNALKFYASLRIDIRRKEALKEGTDIIGNRVRVKIVKNKVAPPFKEVEFDVLYNEGISKLGDMIDVAVENNIIQKSGSWFSIGDERIGQGRDAVKKFLQENTAMYAKVEGLVRAKLGIVIPGSGAIATPPSTNGTSSKNSSSNGSSNGSASAPPAAPHPATAAAPAAAAAVKKLSVKPA
jgi:recombination protein RecA